MDDFVNLAQEYALIDFANRLENHRQGRVALLFNLSLLKPQNRREHHLRIATTSLEEAIATHNGQIFLLANQDIMLVLRDVNAEVLDEVIVKMRSLFANDPLSIVDEHGNALRSRFVELVNVEGQYEVFLKLVQKILKNEQVRQKRLREINAHSNIRSQKANQPLTSSQLTKIEEMLSMADLTNVFRRQAVCLIQEDATPKPVFLELFLSIGTLASVLMPDVQLSTNRWLFMHLTQTLDLRMLKILMRGDDNTINGAYSLNFNVSTVLHQQFLSFDASLRQEIRSTMIIEFQFVDIIADFEGYVFARDFLKDRGYRICIDGVTTDLLPLVDRQYLGADLVKVSSSRLFTKESDSLTRQYLSGHIERFGPKRVILSRCDNEAVIETGQSMGITLFQGYYLDQYLSANSRKRGAAKPNNIMIPSEDF